MYPFATLVLSDIPFETSLSIYPSEKGPYRCTLPPKKNDDFNSKRVLQCFLPLAMYPFGLKGCNKIYFLINAPFGRFSLAMYPSDRFFLKAERVRALRRAAPGSAPRVYG